MISEALVNAFEMHSDGSARSLAWQEIETVLPSPSQTAFLWLHLDWSVEGVTDWLVSVVGLDPTIAESLSTRGTRPSVFFYDTGYSANFRGVNLNDQNDPADMISVRMWISDRLVITLRNKHLRCFDDIRASISQSDGPKNPDDFALQVAERLTFRVETTLRGIEERLEDLEDEEEKWTDQTLGSLRRTSSDIRHQLSRLRRHLAPQRDALGFLAQSKPAWPNKQDKRRARALSDKTIRLVEEFDAFRERIQIVNDNLVSHESERMNRTMYWLTVIAGLFLPVSFLTGLLGVNVGGIPLAENPAGFWVFGIVLAVLFAGEIWLFKKIRLI